ncbi:tyrosine-type recombinase/integrase [Faecalibacterium sp. 4P15]|uniref:tyrosine-type recombinase/integrase n=1 Tax=Faecalibacterium duncaniae (strain DSM 17677 / JCM 31915 / A2-165) TaxID=411483 RepID=UPI00164A4032|nr:tyrosine-type recombinase/integrase [Faecalibacterium duncaniae]MBC5721115.1 tyrosine-type recombinase/integrase [Faecalibacterium duncaniae]
MKKIQKSAARFDNLKQDFLDDKKYSGTAEATLNGYRYDITRFLKFLSDEQLAVNEAGFKRYVIHLTDSGMTANSVNHYIRSVKVFLYWCMEQDEIAPFKIRMVKAQETIKDVYTQEELCALIQLPKREDSFVVWRSWAIINFILGTAAREATVCEMQMQDISFDDRTIKFRHLLKAKKDGSMSYLVRVYNGRTQDDKVITRCKTVTPPAGMAKKKAEKWVQEQAVLFEQQVTNGLVLDSDMLLDDLIDRWFEEYANKQLKAKTLYDYRRMRGRISAGLGHLKVSKIKPAHVMAFYNNLEEKGVRRDSTYTATKALLKLLPRGTRGELAKQAGIGQDTMRMVYAGKNVSRKTAEKVSAAVGLAFSKAFVEHTKKDGKLNNNSVIRYQAMLSSIFKKGVQWGLINENPCSRAEHPKAEEIDIRVLTEEEIPTLLDALSDAPPQYSVITQLALLLGARRGEICALRWSDIDFEKGTLSIKRTVQSIPGIGLVFNTPKTRRGKRCLRIGADCVELLQEYRRYQKAERFRIGSAWVRKVTLENGKVVDNDMLFTKWNGEPMDPDIISSWFPKFLEAHNLPDVNFHSLRHSNASILIAAHVPITTVSGRLGHAQTSTTLNYYASALQLGTHLLHKEGVVRAIGRLVLGGQDMSNLVERFGFTAKGPTHRHWSACRAYL